MRVLVATTVLPHGRQSGGEVATGDILEALGRVGAELTVLGFRRPEDPPPSDPRLRTLETRAIESLGSPVRAAAWGALALARGEPYTERKYRSRRWAARLRELGGADVALIDHSQLHFLLPHARRTASRVVAVLHNLEHDMYAKSAATAQRDVVRRLYAREARRMRDAERALVAGADEAWVLTADDAAGVRSLQPGASVRVVPIVGTDTPAPAAPAPPAYDVGLIGTWSWWPNREALEWFLAHVLPQLPPGTRVGVAGRGADWLRDRHPEVTYEGFVADPVAFMRGLRVLAIPTQTGGGIQIKTLDAIAAGVRVVATPVALRGIDTPPATVEVAAGADALLAALHRAWAAGPPPPGAGAEWVSLRRRRLEAEVRSGLGLAAP